MNDSIQRRMEALGLDDTKIKIDLSKTVEKTDQLLIKARQISMELDLQIETAMVMKKRASNIDGLGTIELRAIGELERRIAVLSDKKVAIDKLVMEIIGNCNISDKVIGGKDDKFIKYVEEQEKPKATKASTGVPTYPF